MDLDGRVAIVTGAAGNLGSAAATALAKNGVKVLAADIDIEGVGELAEQLHGQALTVEPLAADVSLESDVKRMVSTAVSTFGGLDIIFNNAGLVGLEYRVDLLDLPVDLWDRMLAVHLRGVMLGCKHAIPAMRNRGGGSIINTSSDSSLAGDIHNYAYAAAKGGINVLTRYVATGYGRDNIRCNAIAPGIHVHPDTLEQASPERKAFFQRFEDHVLLPRLGTAEDIAKAVLFLASDSSQYITGQLIQVDGGLIGHVPHLADMRRVTGVE